MSGVFGGGQKRKNINLSFFFLSSFSEVGWVFVVCPGAESSCKPCSSSLELRPHRGRSVVLLPHADLH